MTIWKFTDNEAVRISGEGSLESRPARTPEDLSDFVGRADALVAEGNYIAALEIYRSLLAGGSSRAQLMQRFEELKQLILLSGMRRDLVVYRLERFLAMLRKRGNERRNQAI